MFRKFLKVLPKDDGKSMLDWEEYYVNESLHLWGDQAKVMLNELVTPVPDLFRPVGKEKGGPPVNQSDLEEKASSIEHDHLIRGYIQATPKRDHKFLRKKLESMEIDMTPYEHLFR